MSSDTVHIIEENKRRKTFLNKHSNPYTDRGRR
jgi:hypothetical protein